MNPERIEIGDTVDAYIGGGKNPHIGRGTVLQMPDANFDIWIINSYTGIWYLKEYSGIRLCEKKRD